VLDLDPAPSSPKRGRSSPIFGPCLLWPNSWIDQNDTWYGGTPRPRRHCIRWGPAPPSKKGTTPNFRPISIMAKVNGCMYQDTTWYGGRPQPRRHCVRWEPSSPPLKWHSPQFSASIHCGQTAGSIKMPLGTEVNTSPDNVVLDGVAALPL